MGEHPNFIRDFVTLREGTEVPETFALWTGITGVSTALGRRVWLDMVKYKLYPNFFIVLTAGSGKCRKSTTIGWLEDIFDLLDPRPTLIAQKITPEALWGALKNEQGNGEVIVKGKDSSEATVVADELTVFLNRRSYEQGLGDLLIQLFDCKRRPEYETRARGKETINNSFLTVLGGATMKGIRDTMPEEIIGSGLASRMIFVFVDKPPPPVSRFTGTDNQDLMYEQMAKTLERIRTIEGQVTLDKPAWAYYDEGYNTFYDNSPFYHDPALSGYASRRHAHWLKLAIILAVADTEDIQVKVKHLEGAKLLLENAEGYMPRVMQLITGTNVGAMKETVLMAIKKEGRVQLSTLIKELSHLISRKELEEVLDTLLTGKMITTYSTDKAIFYRYVPEAEKKGSK